ncbi:MAG: hypothetical protein M9962_05670 [Oligoflexia bacterium]|nr:hypothetical protein [Oligoflexia bacterium]
MPMPRLDALKIKAKLLQKAKSRVGSPIALKEAYEILAKSAGFSSWREMKSTLDTHEILRPPHASALWNVWYGSYEEAKTHVLEHGGYLLPYQKQFFVCDENYVLNLGIETDDPDLKKVGRDWVTPKDATAWNRLLVKISRSNPKE